MADPLSILTREQAREHLNKYTFKGPGEDEEFDDMIRAAVKRVARHLGGRDPDPGEPLELLACKVALADFWETQQPTTGGSDYGGRDYADQDAIASPAPLINKLTALLGLPTDLPGESSQGAFPPPQPWPDPVEPRGWCG